MLLRIAFAALLLAALGETMLHGTHALAQVALRRRALVAVDQQIDAATTLARDAVANAIASGGDPRTLDPVPPSPAPACRIRTRHGCVLVGVSTISFSLPVVGASSPPSPCADGACATYEQRNDAVDEGRIRARIAAKVVGPQGNALAERVAYVNFRTWRVAPYVALTGDADGANPVDGSAATVGDDGGIAPAAGDDQGTLIDVRYENAITKQTMPANVWRAHVASGQATTAPWSP